LALALNHDTQLRSVAGYAPFFFSFSWTIMAPLAAQPPLMLRIPVEVGATKPGSTFFKHSSPLIVPIAPPTNLEQGGALLENASQPQLCASAAGECKGQPARPPWFPLRTLQPPHTCPVSSSSVCIPSPTSSRAVATSVAPQQLPEGDSRRPTDPFFYPTTLNPITALGLSFIEQTIPPKEPGRSASFRSLDKGEDPRILNDPCAPLFVPPPLGAFVDEPEEMRSLQQQNNSLDRNIQALEHAKSQAAATSAQALQNIRKRQQQMRKESQLALQRAKEMQKGLDVQLSSRTLILSDEHVERRVDGQLSSGRSHAVSQVVPSGQHTANGSEQSLPLANAGLVVGGDHEIDMEEVDARRFSPPLEVLGASRSDERAVEPQPAFELQTPEGVAREGAALAHLERSGWTLPTVPAGTNKPKVLPRATGTDRFAPDLSPSQAPIGRTVSGGDSSISGMQMCQTDVSAIAVTPRRVSPDTQLGALSALDVQQQSAQSTTVSRDLSSHHAISNSVLPTGEPYVDALGMPLGPILALNLPNIKDEPVLAQPENELRSQSDHSQIHCTEAVTAGARALSSSCLSRSAGPPAQLPSMSGDVGDCSQQSSVMLPQTSLCPAEGASFTAFGDHECGTPCRAERAASGTDELDHTHVSCRSASAEGEITATLDMDRRSLGDGGDDVTSTDGADVAAGAVAATPSSTSMTGVQVAPEQAAQMLHEALVAELQECLDTIRWCASSVTREGLRDVQQISRPAPGVRAVLQAVALLLGLTEGTWDRLKRHIGTSTFPERIQRFDCRQSVTREQFKRLRELLAHPDFDEELIKTASFSLVPLAMWCRAIGVFLSTTKFRGGPEIRPVAEKYWAAAGYDALVFDPDIQRLTVEELRHVQNLTVSRRGVGRIQFPGHTDCSNLDFDRILRLEVGQVLVYPEGCAKPDVGVGLNKPALVTMYKCNPPSGGKLLKDIKAQERYKQKIKEMTERKSAKFVEYDCKTGIWIFSVDHF